MTEEGRYGLKLLAQNFGRSEIIGRAARECGSEIVYAAVNERFSLTKPQGGEGFDFTQSEDNQRHLMTQDMDHLLALFQCDLYHLINITNRDTGQTLADIKLIVSIGRSNLDALWAREQGTVAAIRRESTKI